MRPRATDWLIEHLSRGAVDAAGDATDGQLLGRFLARRDEAAFEALLRRHGPMVLGVCRRVLGNHPDADDAFQATFLVLVRKAATVRPASAVGNWLYGVAYRTALEARTAAARRRQKEREVADMARGRLPDDDSWGELRRLLDQELSCLPDKYRTAIVLCDLEGKTQKEAARLLGCPEGTVAGRLSRARRLLARRLGHRGVALTASGLAAALARPGSAAPLPRALTEATMKAVAAAAGGTALGTVSTGVISLTEGVVRSMLVSKLKGLTMIVVAAGVLAGGAVLMTHPQWAVGQVQGPNDPTTPASAGPGRGPQEALRLPFGPAPVQAVARMGPDGHVLLRMATPDAAPAPGGARFNRPDAEPPTTTTGYRRGEVKVFDTQGHEVNWAFLPRLLDPEAVVLVTTGDRPDPLHLRVFKEGLLVFVLSRTAMPGRTDTAPGRAPITTAVRPATRVVAETRVSKTTTPAGQWPKTTTEPARGTQVNPRTAPQTKAVRDPA